jgi:zinc transport system substrate-binding protein
MTTLISRKTILFGLLTLLLLAFISSGCGRSETESENSASSADSVLSSKSKIALPAKVLTVNYPLEYFASTIMGELGHVTYPGPANEDPAYWVPTTEIAQEYQQADLVLLNGAGYAQWLDKFSLPRKNQLNTGASFRDQWISETEAVTHSHGLDGEHTHTGFAFTTWLDPMLAIQQANAIHSILKTLIPDQQRTFAQNHRPLVEELNHLDSELGSILANQSNQPWLASHPVYQYFARRYELSLESLHWEPGQELEASDWVQFDEILSAHPAKYMLWEGEPSNSVKEGLRSRGVTPILFETVSTRPETGDYLKSMWSNFERLKQVLSEAE